MKSENGSVSRAGGEEFDFGFKIKELNKKNIKFKNAGYSGYWCDIFQRSKNIIERTEKYIPIFLKKRTALLQVNKYFPLTLLYLQLFY